MKKSVLTAMFMFVATCTFLATCTTTVTKPAPGPDASEGGGGGGGGGGGSIPVLLVINNSTYDITELTIGECGDSPTVFTGNLEPDSEESFNLNAGPGCYVFMATGPGTSGASSGDVNVPSDGYTWTLEDAAMAAKK